MHSVIHYLSAIPLENPDISPLACAIPGNAAIVSEPARAAEKSGPGIAYAVKAAYAGRLKPGARRRNQMEPS